MESDEQRIIVSGLDGQTRTDKFLASRFSHISRTQLKKSFDGDLVSCNGESVKPKHLLSSGDVLTFKIIIPPETSIRATEMPLDILFEDEHIIVINKPTGMIVHSGSGISEPTLVEGILSHCTLSKLGGNTRPGVVHRIDKDTTGTIIFAKTDEAYLKLIKLFSERRIKKEYLAILCGNIVLSNGTIDKPIGRHSVVKTKMCISDNGKPAITEWTLLETFLSKFSLLKINLLTGRTHQIRVHMSSIGHPLLGDFTYGYNSNYSDKIKSSTPLLHAKKLKFLHPITKSYVEIIAPLPKKFLRILEELRKLNG